MLSDCIGSTYFSQMPGLFTLTPPLEAVLQLEALTFRASLK